MLGRHKEGVVHEDDANSLRVACEIGADFAEGCSRKHAGCVRPRLVRVYAEEDDGSVQADNGFKMREVGLVPGRRRLRDEFPLVVIAWDFVNYAEFVEERRTRLELELFATCCQVASMHDEERDVRSGGLLGDFIEDSLQGTDGLIVVYIEALNQGCSEFVPPFFAVCELISEVKIGEVNDSRNRVVRHGLSRKSRSTEGRSLEGVLSS